MGAPVWPTKKLHRNVFEIRIPYTRNSGFEFWFLPFSDLHIDSVDCDFGLFERLMKQVFDRNGAAAGIGDQFDLMQGKFDPRSRKQDLDPQYMRECYIDDVIENAASKLAPYAERIVMLSDGNHEDSIKKRLETDVTQRTIALLNSKTGSRIAFGGYCGTIRFVFTHKGRTSLMRNVGYHHGTGLKSVAAMDRRIASHPDIDVHLYGHFHRSFLKVDGRMRLSQRGIPYQDRIYSLGMPGFKDEIGDECEGWPVTKGFNPQPRGTWWLRFYYNRPEDRIMIEPIPAF